MKKLTMPLSSCLRCAHRVFKGHQVMFDCGAGPRRVVDARDRGVHSI